MKSQQERDSRYPVWSPGRIMLATQQDLALVDPDEFARASFIWIKRPAVEVWCGPLYCYILSIAIWIAITIFQLSSLAYTATGMLVIFGMWWARVDDKRYLRWKRDYFISLDRILRNK